MRIIAECFRRADEFEKEHFSSAAAFVGEIEGGRLLSGGARKSGLEGTTNIGSLGERTLHLTFKYYFEPDNSYHEIKCGRYHADIFRDGEIIEVQTGNCAPLAKKLSTLTEQIPVTVVHPIVAEKRLVWIDPQSGEMTGFRKSPKSETIYDVFRRIYSLRNLLERKAVSFVFPVVSCEEYKLKSGRTNDGKCHGAVRMNRVPTELFGEYRFRNGAEFIKLLPQEFHGKEFTVKQLAQSLKLDARRAHAFASVLCFSGASEICGKNGNAHIYRLKNGAHG